MHMGCDTPPRGTQSSSAAAFFTSPSSPVPRRPEATPTSAASSHLRDASFSSMSSPRPPRPQPPQPPHSHHKPRSSRTPASVSSSPSSRYVSAPTRQNTSMARFLLTSTESKTPMLIRAAQQRQRPMRSPSREHSLPVSSLEDASYPSPTRFAVERGTATAASGASPRSQFHHPRSLSRAGSAALGGSTRLSSVFAKMHLDPSVRSSRDRSVSNASVLGGNGDGGAGDGDKDGSSPPNFSLEASAMDWEPYTTKLARTLFSDVAQTTVLSVNDTAVVATPRFTAVPSNDMNAVSRTTPTPIPAAPTPTTPRSPDIAGLALNLQSNFDDEEEVGFGGRRGRGAQQQQQGDGGEDDDSGEERSNARLESESDGEDEANEMSENYRGGHVTANGSRNALDSRAPLASSNVNLFGMSERERYDASLGVVFECNRTRNFTTPSFRVIPHTPERILDAADMEDDFYMNLIDWSATSDVLCVALQSCVYLWDAKTCGITELPRVTASAYGVSRPTNTGLVCGLSWAADGQHLAVGRHSGLVEVWDVTAQEIVHSYRQHTDRTVSLAWEPQGGSLLASGSRDSTIVLRDVRERDVSSPYTASHGTATSVLQAHETEVCGLKWSPTGAMLASGGNDNQLLLWDRRSITTGGGGGGVVEGGSASSFASTSAQPLYYLNKHTAAVKALSWNPCQPALLASGGGSHDKHLRFWNSLTGECVHHIHTGSQVCGVVWNRSGTELVTAHGYTDNQLSIWRYPSLRRIANLIGHTSRVLHLALSADGETVVSAAGDETLRFWRCFPSSELREASPHLYRSFYSSSSASSAQGGSPYAHGGGLGGSPGGGVAAASRARAAAMAAGRFGSASPGRDSLSFMNEEIELR